MNYSMRVVMPILAGCDFLAMLLAGMAGYALRAGAQLILPDEGSSFIYFNAVISLFAIRIAKGYDLQNIRSPSGQAETLFLGLSGACAIGFVHALFSNGRAGEDRLPLLASFAVAYFLLLGNRKIAASVLCKISSHHIGTEKIVIVGANEQAEKLMRAAAAAPHAGITVVGVFDDRAQRDIPQSLRPLLLGTTADLSDFIGRMQVDRVVVACAWHSSERVESLLRKLRTIPARIDLLPNELIWCSAGNGWGNLAGIPVAPIWNSRVERQLGLVKRTEDILISFVVLLLIWPVFVAVALAIKMDSTGPALFRQKRHGHKNRVFDVYKFRTMYTEAAHRAGSQLFIQATRDDSRVTRIGHFLRRTSLDELPQFLNVLKGDMSVVGPRPHPLQLNNAYGGLIAEYLARHNVKPGITGWAQVNGLRGETDTFEKMHLRLNADLYYIEHWSLLLDLKVILLTALTVWNHETAY